MAHKWICVKDTGNGLELCSILDTDEDAKTHIEENDGHYTTRGYHGV